MDSCWADIDAELNSFAESNGLHVYARYRDSEVRSIEIVDDQAYSYQLWLEPTHVGWRVCVWDRASRRSEHLATSQDLRRGLDAAYRDVLDWICEQGHTRTSA